MISSDSGENKDIISLAYDFYAIIKKTRVMI
jgi:hypothetical protein